MSTFPTRACRALRQACFDRLMIRQYYAQTALKTFLSQRKTTQFPPASAALPW